MVSIRNKIWGAYKLWIFRAFARSLGVPVSDLVLVLSSSSLFSETINIMQGGEVGSRTLYSASLVSPSCRHANLLLVGGLPALFTRSLPVPGAVVFFALIDYLPSPTYRSSPS